MSPRPDPHGAAIPVISVRVKKAVELTGIGRSKIYELIGAGEIETVKVGRLTLIPYDSLRRLIERR